MTRAIKFYMSKKLSITEIQSNLKEVTGEDVDIDDLKKAIDNIQGL